MLAWLRNRQPKTHMQKHLRDVWQLNPVFRELIDIYRDSGKKRGLKESTIYKTSFSASSFLLAMQNRGRESLNDIDEKDVISYFIREDGRSP